MAIRRERKLAMLAKIEGTYGTDSTPDGTSAIVCRNVQLTPLDSETRDRDLYQTHMGAQGQLLANEHVSMSFEVELTGSGEAGTAPGYGPLLRACGMSETIEAETSVEYAPVSDAFESVSAYMNLDGVLHKLLGARGNVGFVLGAGQVPLIRFSNFRGLLVPAADVAMPAQTFTGFTKPVIVNKANTTLSLHGVDAAIAESLEIDLGNEVSYQNKIGKEAVEIVDRMSSGSAVLEAAAMSVKNWYSVAQARTRGALEAVHGTVAGNIATLACPAVEIGAPTHGASNKVRNISLPLIPCPDEGNDEVVLTLT